MLDELNSLRKHPEADEHVRPGLRLTLLPLVLQLLMLLQCMYQGFILTMLGRLAGLIRRQTPHSASTRPQDGGHSGCSPTTARLAIGRPARVARVWRA